MNSTSATTSTTETNSFTEPWTLDKLLPLREELIAYHDEEYLVVSKPADLRMDGPHEATLQKLLMSFFPTPSMFEEAESNDEAIRSYVSKLSKWSDVKDNNLRPCHQLDYATSGVILIAKSRQAAATASQSFRDRLTQKTYVAIVHGHVNPDSFPVYSRYHCDFESWENGDIEKNYRKSRKVGRKFRGFMPAHAIFEKWKGHMKSTKSNHPGHTKKRKRRLGKSVDGVAEPKIDFELIELKLNEKEKLLKMKWSEVKSIALYKEVFEMLAQSFNDELKRNVEEMTSDNNMSVKDKNMESYSGGTTTHVSHVFRVMGEGQDVKDKQSCSFYVNVDIASLGKKDFRMAFDLNALCETSDDIQKHYSSFTTGYDVGKLEFKPALTRCEVLWTGHINGFPVSKVKLQPKTGRRHQLRVHMVACGHPIVGDATYEYPSPGREELCNRMCLHAHKLSLPLLNSKVMEFIAPDPFQVVGMFNELSISGGGR